MATEPSTPPKEGVELAPAREVEINSDAGSGTGVSSAIEGMRRQSSV